MTRSTSLTLLTLLTATSSLLGACPADSPAPPPPAAAQAPTPAPPPKAPGSTAAFDASMKGLVPDYLVVSQALAADETEGVAAAAARLMQKAAKLDASTVSGEHAAHYQGVPRKLQAAAGKLAAATEIKAMRLALKEASRPIAMWAEMSKQTDLNVAFCSMAGGSWLQKGKEIHNPYYGAKMLHCGEVVAGPDKPTPPQ